MNFKTAYLIAFAVSLSFFITNAVQPVWAGTVNEFKQLERSDLLRIDDSQTVWRDAHFRATRPLLGHDVRPKRPATLMGGMSGSEGFHFMNGKGFRAEQYSSDPYRPEIIFELDAAQAHNSGDSIKLAELRLTFHFSAAGLSKLGASLGQLESKIPADLQQIKIVITALGGEIFTERLEGLASGGVSMQVISKTAPQEEPVISIECDRLKFRVWENPAIGSTEVSLAAIADEPGRPDPEVRSKFLWIDDKGEKSTIEIRAEGMIFENSTIDHLRPLYTEQGAPAGGTNVARRHFLFHRKIQVDTVGNALGSLIPFSDTQTTDTQKSTEEIPEKQLKAVDLAKQQETAGDKKSEATIAARAIAAVPKKTRMFCGGPALLDLAVYPRKPTPAPHKTMVPLARRFTFSNGCKLLAQAGDNPRNETRYYLACNHAALQYAGGSEGRNMPEYALGFGGVRIKGTKPVGNAKGLEERKPFTLECWRVFYDGLAGTVQLEGTPGTPLLLVDELGQLETSKLFYDQATQSLSMPNRGPKTLRIRPEALLSAAKQQGEGQDKTNKKEEKDKGGGEGLLGLAAGGDLEILWYGVFQRELRVPEKISGAPVQVREALIFDDVAHIKQESKDGTLELSGNKVTVFLDAVTRRLERIDGDGNLKIKLPELEVHGEHLIHDLRYDEKGQIVYHVLNIVGSADRSGYTTLYQGETAIRSRQFMIDLQKNDFRALGGVVGVIRLPENGETAAAQPVKLQQPDQKKEQAAATDFMPSFSLSSGGTLALQCDGELRLDSERMQLVINENVVIRKDTLTILMDELRIDLKPPMTQGQEDKLQNDGKKLENSNEPAGLLGGNMLSGELKAVHGSGNIEIVAPGNLTHCDRLRLDLSKEFLKVEADEKVRIYMASPTGGTMLLEVDHYLEVDVKNNVFTPGGRLFLHPYTEPLPQRERSKSVVAKDPAGEHQP